MTALSKISNRTLWLVTFSPLRNWISSFHLRAKMLRHMRAWTPQLELALHHNRKILNVPSASSLCLSLPVWLLITCLTWSLLICPPQFLSACFYSPSSVCCVQMYVSPCVGFFLCFCDFRFRDCFSWSDLHMPGVCKFDPFINSLACYTCRAQEATVLCFLHESKPVQASVKSHIFSTSALQHLEQHIVHLWYGLPG